ncbi:5-formyltetrahydrofolate cyclo-ligase [Marinomonas sp. THO17]|uniref:5-formyltetrahydrofolate cyclo-ligase n=1 Tax=Marinomonas sp. THO17 TaxID=3149048 RepID=UPI00336C09AF
MTNTRLNRQSLRQSLRQARRQLSPQQQNQAAQALLEQTLQSPWLQTAKRVALYLANDGEISPHLICEYCWQHKITTYLPVVQDKHLEFALYKANSLWQNNRFGIAEPKTSEYVKPDELDLIFMPLVGFDAQGGRLGMGGGFYDRSFAHKKSQQKPLLIGLAHDCQQVEKLPLEDWDVPLEGILSPSQSIQI